MTEENENRPLEDLAGRKTGFQDAPGATISGKAGSKRARLKQTDLFEEGGHAAPKPRVPKGRR